MKADRCTYVKVIYRGKGTWSDEIALEVRQNVMIGINIKTKSRERWLFGGNIRKSNYGVCLSHRDGLKISLSEIL